MDQKRAAARSERAEASRPVKREERSSRKMAAPLFHCLLMKNQIVNAFNFLFLFLQKQTDRAVCRLDEKISFLIVSCGTSCAGNSAGSWRCGPAVSRIPRVSSRTTKKSHCER